MMRHSFDTIYTVKRIQSHEAPSAQTLNIPARTRTADERRDSSNSSHASEIELVVMDDEVQAPRRGSDGLAAYDMPSTPMLNAMATKPGKKRRKGDIVEVTESRSRWPLFALKYKSAQTLSPGGDDETSRKKQAIDGDDFALAAMPHTAPASAGAVDVATFLPALLGIGADVLGFVASAETAVHCYKKRYALLNERRELLRLAATATDLRHPLIEQMRDNATVQIRSIDSESRYNWTQGVAAGLCAGAGMALVGVSILLGPAMLGKLNHAMAEAAVEPMPYAGIAFIFMYGIGMALHDMAHLKQHTQNRATIREVDEKSEVVGIEGEVLELMQARLKRQQLHSIGSGAAYGIMCAGVAVTEFVGAQGLALLGISASSQLGAAYYDSRHIGYMSQFTPEQKMKLGSIREIMNHAWQHDAEYAVYNAEKATKRLLFPLGEDSPTPFGQILSGVAAIKRNLTKEHLMYTAARESLYRMFIGQAKAKRRFYKLQRKLFEYQLAKTPDGNAADEAKRTAFWKKHQHYIDKSRIAKREIGWLEQNMNRDVAPWEGVFDVSQFMARRHIFDDWGATALNDKVFRRKLMELGVVDDSPRDKVFGDVKRVVDANQLVWVLRPEGGLGAGERVAIATQAYDVAQKVVFTVAKRRAQDATRELIDILIGRALLSVEENEAEQAASVAQTTSVSPSTTSRAVQNRIDAVTV